MRKLLLLPLLSLSVLSAELIDTLQNKPKLSARDLADKNEGNHFSGLPLINSDPDKGIGYGARVIFTQNGERNDTTFEYVPYKSQMFLQFFQSSNGYQYHWFHWDQNYVANTPFRLTTDAVLDGNSQANYYGNTAAISMKDLTASDGTVSTTQEQHTKVIKKLGDNYYNRYSIYRPRLEVNAQYDLLGGLIRMAGGFKISHTTIVNYQNTTAANSKGALKNDSKKTLLDDSVLGSMGGITSGIKLGIIYDTRDFAPNPKSGTANDFTAEFFTPLLGSDYTYQRYTFSSKNFYTPNISGYDGVTLAGQYVYSAIRGDAPFYDLNGLGYTDTTLTGLGGLRTIRGYAQDRFLANVKTFINLEARITAWDFHNGNKFILVPFADSGAVFDGITRTDYTKLKTSTGLGLRFAWNQSTIIMVDYAVSSEDTNLYINFNNIF